MRNLGQNLILEKYWQDRVYEPQMFMGFSSYLVLANFEYALGKSLVFFFSSGPNEHVLVIHLCYIATFSFTFVQGLRNG